MPQRVSIIGAGTIGASWASCFLVRGVELAGPFPGDLQQELVFVGAVAADSKEGAAAKAFLDYLKTPEAVGVFKAKGVTAG